MKRLLVVLALITLFLTTKTFLTLQRQELFNYLVEQREHFFDANEVETFGTKARFLNGTRFRNVDYQKARAEFEACTSEDSNYKTEALYNLGNMMLEEAILKKNYGMFMTAINYYTWALRENPHYMNAKYNLELAKKILKSSKIIQMPESPMINQPGLYPFHDKDI